MKKKCPKCLSIDIAEFLYGMPVNSPELEDDLKNKKIIIGGCVLLDEYPQWHCNDCKYEWSDKDE